MYGTIDIGISLVLSSDSFVILVKCVANLSAKISGLVFGSKSVMDHSFGASSFAIFGKMECQEPALSERF